MLVRLVLACIWFLCAHAAVCAPLDLTPESVTAGAQSLYRARLADAEQKFELDTDTAFVVRVKRIADRLIVQAMHDDPETRNFKWEIHVTDDAQESASGMAGGKLLVGQAYVEKLALNDSELAMLLGHEIAHIVLAHNFREMQEALKMEPERSAQSFAALEYAIDHDAALMTKLADLNSAQESEADMEGLRMAARAGWAPLALAGYFKKMAHADPMANFDSREHPAAARRWRAARELAAQISAK
jgi:predicted Zn-dependent protease